MRNSLLTSLIVLLLLSACAAGPGQGTSAPAAPTQAVQSTAPARPSPAAATATQAPATAAVKPSTTPLPLIATPVPKQSTAAVPEGYFQNPVLQTNFPDPFLLKEGDTWYAYATNGSGRNVQMATSTDLVHWQLGRDAMPALASWIQLSSSDVWAPEVMKAGDQYLLYYTARDKQSGKQCVGVAVSDKPEGKFKDTRDAPLVCQTDQGGTIDPSPFRDGEQLYLYFKNDGNCCGYPTYIYVQKMAPDGQSLQGDPVQLVRNDKPWEGHVIEAPTMVQHDGRYYLFYSANNYGGVEYAVGYATCETVAGPCQDAPENPILASQMKTQPIVVGPGHQAIIHVGDETWIVYHAWQVIASGIRGNNRYMWMDRLEWVGGKPDVIGPSTGPQPDPPVEGAP